MIKKRLLSLLKGSNKYIGFTVMWNFVSLLMNVIIIFTVAGLLNALRLGTDSGRMYLVSAAVVTASILIRVICQKAAVRSSYLASTGVKKVLRGRIYKKLLSLGNSYQEEITTAEVVQVAMEGVDQLEIYFGKYLPQLFYSLLAPLVLFGILANVNMKSAAVLLICVPLIPVSIVAVQKFAKKLLSKYWDSYTGLGDSFLENLTGLTTLKVYQADEKKTAEMDREAEHFRKITMKVLTMQLNSISVMDLVAYGGAAAGIITALFQYQKGALDFTGLFAIILLSSEFFIPLRLLGSFFHIAMNGMAASDKIFRILDMEEGPEKTENIQKGAETVSAAGLSFSYEEEREILSGISFEIPKNSFVSFVGKSGCGKSTIAGLLTGRNKNYKGSLTIGGHEISAVRENSLTDAVTLVNHNGYLFAGSIEYNLRMGRENATEEELWKVLKTVRLNEFIRQSGGLSFELTEQASNLSGGQRQRLVLARALLKDSPVYIFDEATSNIDVESEEAIMQVIYGMKKNKTVILISHGLANVRPSDCIYLLEGGQIAESGTHEELYARGGTYTELYRNQETLMTYTGKKEAAA